MTAKRAADEYLMESAERTVDTRHRPPRKLGLIELYQDYRYSGKALSHNMRRKPKKVGHAKVSKA